MREHTPGPWKWSVEYTDNGGRYDCLTAANGEEIIGENGSVDEYHKALIAAAPDLLASVRELTRCAPADDSAASAVYARARAAIAKAKGDTE